MKLVIDENLFKVDKGWVVVSDDFISKNEWMINLTHPPVYPIRAGNSTLVNTGGCKKIIGTIGFRLDGIEYKKVPHELGADALCDEFISLNYKGAPKHERYTLRQGYLAGYNKAMENCENIDNEN